MPKVKCFYISQALGTLVITACDAPFNAWITWGQ